MGMVLCRVGFIVGYCRMEIGFRRRGFGFEG